MQIRNNNNNFTFEFMNKKEFDTFSDVVKNYINNIVQLDPYLYDNIKEILEVLETRIHIDITKTQTLDDPMIVTTLSFEEATKFLMSLLFLMHFALNSDSFKFALLLEHMESLLKDRRKEDMSLFEIFAFSFVAKHLEWNMDIAWNHTLKEEKEKLENKHQEREWNEEEKRQFEAIEETMNHTSQSINTHLEELNDLTNGFLNDVTGATVLHMLHNLVEKGLLKVEDAANEVGLPVEQFLLLSNPTANPNA